MKIFFVDQFC